MFSSTPLNIYIYFHPATFQHTRARAQQHSTHTLTSSSPAILHSAQADHPLSHITHTHSQLHLLVPQLAISPHLHTLAIPPHIAFPSTLATTPPCDRPTYLHTRTQQPPPPPHILPTLPRYMHRSIRVAVGVLRVALAMRSAAVEAHALASVLLVIIRTKEVVAERATIQPIMPRGGRLWQCVGPPLARATHRALVIKNAGALTRALHRCLARRVARRLEIEARSMRPRLAHLVLGRAAKVVVSQAAQAGSNEQRAAKQDEDSTVGEEQEDAVPRTTQPSDMSTWPASIRRTGTGDMIKNCVRLRKAACVRH